MAKPKLIIIYGFAGLGKTTLAKKLNQDLPFSLYLEADDLLNMIGQWIKDEDLARNYVYHLIESMAKTHLNHQNDVIIPWLLTDSDKSISFERLAYDLKADFIEVSLEADKDNAISYLYERGTWGESNTIKITEKDHDHINHIFDDMSQAMKTRNKCQKIPYYRNDIEKTYLELKRIVAC